MEGYSDNLLNYYETINFNTFMFKYLKPIKIIDESKLKDLNVSYNNLIKKNLNYQNICKIIDIDKLNFEIVKEIKRKSIIVYINDKIVFDDSFYNNSKTNISKIQLLNVTKLIDILDEKLIDVIQNQNFNNKIVNKENLIILMKNTVYDSISNIYHPMITDDGLFKIYPFLKSNNFELYYVKSQLIGFQFKSSHFIINIYIENNKFKQIIEYTGDLIILYTTDDIRLKFGKCNLKITIDYNNNQVYIESNTEIYDNYKIFLNILNTYKELPENILYILFNKDLIENIILLNIIKQFIENYIDKINYIKLEYYLNFLIRDGLNKKISKNYNILIEILYSHNKFSENTLDLLLKDNLLNNDMILLILKKLKEELLEKEIFEYYLNLIINIEFNNYSLFLQLEYKELETILNIIFNDTFYSLKIITKLNIETNINFILNIIEVNTIDSSNKICDIIIKSTNNLKSDIYIKWNNNLILDNNNFKYIKLKYNQINSTTKNIEKIKKNNLIKINYLLLKLISKNENNKLLLYFYNEIFIIFIENNIKEEFISFLLSYYDRIETIIDANINIHSKIISIIKLIYEYINLSFYNSETKLIRSNHNHNFQSKVKRIIYKTITSSSKIEKNEYNILDTLLRRTIYNYSFKPIKNYQPLYNSDFLIINYNEGDKIFNHNDCLSMLYKVMIEQPSIIIICTQESRTKGNYQDYLKEVLEFNTKLEKDKTYIQVSRIDASTSFKNVKTTIFIRNKSFLYMDKYLIENKKNNYKKFIYKRQSDSKYKYQHIFDYQNKLNSNDIRNKYILKEFSYKLSKDSGLGSFNTFFKGSIFLELIIEKNNKEYKFIIINSHLYYKKSGNTGLKKREKEFIDLINEFKLSDYFNKGYNIFFCGDLNFRLDSFINTNTENYNKYNKISKDIINSYFENNKNTFKNKYINKEELTKKISFNLNPSLNSNLNKNTELLIKFYISIMKTGYHLTCKYKEEENNYNKEINNKIKKNNLETIAIKNGIPRIPSMCDRILYAISNNEFEINTHNFNVYPIPKKSDHKIITLSFEL